MVGSSRCDDQRRVQRCKAFARDARPFERVPALHGPVVGAARRPYVRLGRREDGAVEVRSCAAKSRAVSNRNCVASRRGGKQRNENDQSVTQAARVGRRRELDSVGVDGRVFVGQTKPVGAGANPLAAGRSPVVALMVGDGMAGSLPAIIRETRRVKRCSGCLQRAEEPPGGSQSVHSS